MNGFPHSHPSWTLEQYLAEYHKPTAGTFALFQGYEPLRQLFERDYIEPGVSAIRVTFDSQIDHTYVVLSPDSLEGVESEWYGGRDGIRAAREILKDDVTWWAESISPRPIYLIRKEEKPTGFRSTS